MVKQENNHNQLSFTDMGKGNSVVLLHGYLESKDMWNDIASELANDYRVICPDILGHGKSNFDGAEVSMELAAMAIAEILDSLAIAKCVLIGHSMGGYVALAFAELFPQKLSGLGLFHSHPFADSEEKKASRMADIELLEKSGKTTIVETNIPRLFANFNLERLTDKVKLWKEVAQSTPSNGIIACLKGMASRKDRNEVLAQLSVPGLMIFGRHDNLIPKELGVDLETRHSHIQTVWLENSGHLGIIEETNQTRDAIMSFLLAVFSRA